MKAWFPLALALAVTGCFYPPRQKPAADNKYQLTLALPFDLAWDAVHTVIAVDDLHIITEDPNDGIIESQAVASFSLEDADCGDLRGIATKYHAEPDAGSSAVYNFAVTPKGNEASVVSLQAVFTAPLHVPLHPTSEVNCISRGVQEARLLKEIAQQARKE
ncbi:MAG TPA: hypothetical protein VHS07_04385, partial [Candidatus Binataceae bacterium]|nr:hypothetical protein [Candidatus Binataceae bacterium]